MCELVQRMPMSVCVCSLIGYSQMVQSGGLLSSHLCLFFVLGRVNGGRRRRHWDAFMRVVCYVTDIAHTKHH